jgi:transcriptional regulator with XRE-family HTH domain
MPDRPVPQDALRQLFRARGLTNEAVGVLANTHPSTVGRVLRGEQRARRETVVALARALGISARRMQQMCEAHYLAAHSEKAAAAPEPEALRA